MVLKNDRQAVQAAIKTCNILDKRAVKMVRIRNTISLGEIEISESLIPEAEAHPRVELVGEPYDLPFDETGNLL